MQGTQNVDALIDKLAAKLSVPAAQLWDILVRQARVNIVFDALWALGAVVLAVLVVKWWKGVEEDDYNEDVKRIGLGIVAFIALLVFAISLQSVVTALANPQYAALRLILDALK